MNGMTDYVTAPAAPEAEREILGCALLLDVDDARVALAGLTEADFTDEACALAFTAMCELLSAGEAPTPMATLGQLRRMGRVSSFPASATVGVWIAETYEAAPIPLGCGPARRALDEASFRRKVHQSALRLLQESGCASLTGLAALVTAETTALTAAGKAVTVQ